MTSDTGTTRWLDFDLLERHIDRDLDRHRQRDEGEQRKTYGWATPGKLAVALEPDTVQTPALDLVDAALVELANTPDGRLMIFMPPQEGKSERATRRFTEWVLAQRPDTRIAIASFAQTVARRFSRIIRDDINAHHDEFGLIVRSDVSAQTEWQLAGHLGGVYAVGVGGSLTSRPVDLLIIDDPIKDAKQADSETYREALEEWWRAVGQTRLAPGAQVVLILTRWHEDDLAGRLLAAEDGHRWKVLRIPAKADHDPRKGETDILDREPGEYMVSARGRTAAQWRQIEVQAGPRTFNALYQGRPGSAEGIMFKRDRWQFYDQPLWLAREDGARIVTGFDDLLLSWDMTFKKTKGSDYVAGHVWARRGAEAFLLDRVHGRMDFPETLAAFRSLAARWPQALLKLVEDKANGPAVIAMLGKTVPGIVPVEPDGGKEARAAAVSPLQEARNVWLPAPELCPWVEEVIDEAASFPHGAHDDDVDAMTQALNRLILQPLLAGDLVITEDELDDELADFRITPY